MSEELRYAIVGGPLDGKTVVLEPHQDRYEVYKGLLPLPVSASVTDDGTAQTVVNDTVTYITDGVAGRAGMIPVLRLASWDMSHVVQYLLHERQQIVGTKA